MLPLVFWTLLPLLVASCSPEPQPEPKRSCDAICEVECHEKNQTYTWGVCGRNKGRCHCLEWPLPVTTTTDSTDLAENVLAVRSDSDFAADDLTTPSEPTPWPGYPDCDGICEKICTERNDTYTLGNCDIEDGGHCKCTLPKNNNVIRLVALDDHFDQISESSPTPTPWPGYPDCDGICEKICTERNDTYTLGNCDIEDGGHCKCTLPKNALRLVALSDSEVFTTPSEPTPWPGYPDCDGICEKICTERNDTYTLGNCDIEDGGHCKCTLPKNNFVALDDHFDQISEFSTPSQFECDRYCATACGSAGLKFEPGHCMDDEGCLCVRHNNAPAKRLKFGRSN